MRKFWKFRRGGGSYGKSLPWAGGGGYGYFLEPHIAGKSDINGQEENVLELFRSRRRFGEIKQPKTLNQPQ